ncbi:imidazole glycerol phosphate synthase subunit HisH 1 [Methanobrevibacter cuticularis]|uniref:Imidazole glycerol phosphate synthase subunit HisH n=1 Tax=Methanobrevibacter cuticularis TaxID=47311 RepID=A0A166EBK6_9EURY|nr:imidazole glycerol phosphate synthase subunit HisH [Methanobrevibacter cuticularis]KZX16479.1 imidazole glycerol phosphate synthase subunit HisH 1 [Methanobrevibacter cuticularis]
MITIIDYGSGNLRSISNGFSKIGFEHIITNDSEIIADSEFLVLPGVGAFGQAMKNIDPYKQLIIEHINDGKPFLGICLGLQVLLSESEESPNAKGLDIFKGGVKKLPKGKKIPHMGWNQLKIIDDTCPILKGTNNKFFYFVHSYYVDPEDKSAISAITPYGLDVTAVLHDNNVFATQFHPEKSGIAGLKLLKNFVSLKQSYL